MKFVNPKNDVAFKKIFGNEQKKEILISFLNAVLDLTGEREIADLEILNPYQAPTIEVMKTTLLDVRARDKRGISFIVEMQVENVSALNKGFLYYTAKMYTAQIERGEDYPKLNQVIFIGVLDFVAFAADAYLSRHLILDAETHAHELRDLEFNFIELPKFKKSESELTTQLDKWIYFIKQAGDLSVIPENTHETGLRAAYEVANQFSWTRDELDIYEQRGIRLQDERGAVQLAQQEGHARGLVEGQHARSREIARAMLAEGLDRALIMKLTGLSATELAALTNGA
jgi:predicted transposase/invertase (TIGR01784 family)